jgi:hypothetical protein
MLSGNSDSAHRDRPAENSSIPSASVNNQTDEVIEEEIKVEDIPF